MSTSARGGYGAAPPAERSGDGAVRHELEAAALAAAGAHRDRDRDRDATLLELRENVKAVLVAFRRLRGRETHLRGQKLSYAQFGLLHALAEGSCQSARDLAQHAELSPATVTQMLDTLESIGLVERSRSTSDKRVVLTTLTARGREMLAARTEQMDSHWNGLLNDFDDEQLRAAADVLGVVAGYFSALE